MTLQKVKRFEVECDQCGRIQAANRVSRREALRVFRESEWDLGRGSFADLCPHCSDMDVDEIPTT